MKNPLLRIGNLGKEVLLNIKDPEIQEENHKKLSMIKISLNNKSKSYYNKGKVPYLEQRRETLRTH